MQRDMKVFFIMPGVCFSHGLRFLFELECMGRGVRWQIAHDVTEDCRSFDTGASVRADFALSFAACVSVLRNPYGSARKGRVIDGRN